MRLMAPSAIAQASAFSAVGIDSTSTALSAAHVVGGLVWSYCSPLRFEEYIALIQEVVSHAEPRPADDVDHFEAPQFFFECRPSDQISQLHRRAEMARCVELDLSADAGGGGGASGLRAVGPAHG
jgi:hypothetical protein